MKKRADSLTFFEKKIDDFERKSKKAPYICMQVASGIARYLQKYALLTCFFDSIW